MLTQTGDGAGPAATIDGTAACTLAGGGDVSGSFDSASRDADLTIAFEQPLYTVMLDGTTDAGTQFMGVTWSCGCGSGAATLTRGESTTQEFVIAAGGGIVETALGDSLTIPAGALADNEIITTAAQPVPFEPPAGMASIAVAYDFGPDGTTFDPPATFVFHYDDADLGGGLIDPATLGVYLFDSQLPGWVFQGGMVDTGAQTVTVTIDHFSTYALFGELPAAIDGDGDAVTDATDNCQAISNPPQVDTDADGDGNECDANDDDDSCTDVQEAGDDERFGGLRDPLDFWDFFDVAGTDRSIDINDAVAILGRFGQGPSSPTYNPLYDRIAPIDGQPWRTAPATGTARGIDLSDVIWNLQSFGHSCFEGASGV
jgi:hypothetical protein